MKTSEKIQNEINGLKEQKVNINGVMIDAKKALNEGIKNPLKAINLLNSSVIREMPEVTAALKAIGAKKWDMSLLETVENPHFNIDGDSRKTVICHVGRALKSADLAKEGEMTAIICGRVHVVTIPENMSMTAIMTETKTVAKLRIDAKIKELTADKKAAKKAEKAESKKAAKKAEMTDDEMIARLVANGALSEEVAKTLKK